MNNKKLKIGNKVAYGILQQYGIIKALGKIEVCIETCSIHEEINLKYSMIEGIPLRKLMLLELNFIEVEEDVFTYKLDVDLYLFLIKSIADENIYFPQLAQEMDISKGLKKSLSLNYIKYVHDLQNLIDALISPSINN